MKYRALEQCYELRDKAHQLAMQSTDPQDFALLLNSWDKALERCRILRGKPLPGALKPASAPSKEQGSRSRVIAPVTYAIEPDPRSASALLHDASALPATGDGAGTSGTSSPGSGSPSPATS